MRLEKLPFDVVLLVGRVILSGQIEIMPREQSSGELCGQKNKANAKLNKKRNDMCLATGELIA